MRTVIMMLNHKWPTNGHLSPSSRSETSVSQRPNQQSNVEYPWLVLSENSQLCVWVHAAFWDQIKHMTCIHNTQKSNRIVVITCYIIQFNVKIFVCIWVCFRIKSVRTCRCELVHVNCVLKILAKMLTFHILSKHMCDIVQSTYLMKLPVVRATSIYSHW